jgi:hypothetical protein
MVKATLAQERRDFYTYVIFRRSTGEPCYVGKGQKNRWRIHANHTCNIHLRRIYAKEGNDLPIVKVRENLTDREAKATEIALITAIGRGKNGPLVNLTDGGDGAEGYKHTTDIIERLATQKRGTKLSAEHVAKLAERLRGHLVSKETRRKISIANKGNVITKEQRAQISAALKGRRLSEATLIKLRGRTLSPEHRAKLIGRKQSAETIAKRSLAMTGRTHTEVTRQKLRDSRLGKPMFPKVKERLLLANKGRHLSFEHRAKISSAGKLAKSSPAVRVAISKALRHRTYSEATILKMSLSAKARGLDSVKLAIAARKRNIAERRAKLAGAWLVDPGPESRVRADAVQSAVWAASDEQREQLPLPL